MMSVAATDWAAIAGADAVLAPERDRAAYETGARQAAGHAGVVLRPATTDAVSAIVGHCVHNGIPYIVQSGHTGLVGGSTPDTSGDQVVISLDRMRGNCDIDVDNRSARVSAGVRLSELNTRLEAEGLLFPIDLGADPLVGGMVAANTGGARFLRYGDVRAHTLGLKVVLADAAGTVLHLDAALRKNNTGPDWKQLFIGTSGVFGIVTECVFSVEPLPTQRATALLVPSSEAAILDTLRALEARLGPALSAFELMSGNAMQHALAHASSLRNPFSGGEIPPVALLVEISGPGGDDTDLGEELEQALAALWEQDEAPLDDALFGPPEEIWALRHALSPGVQAAGHLFAFDLAFERSQVIAFRRAMREELARDWPELELCDFGHVGDGGVHFSLVGHDPEACAGTDYKWRLRDWVFERAVERFGGSFSGEHGIGAHNQRYYDRYTSEAVKTLADRFGEALGLQGSAGARFGH